MKNGQGSTGPGGVGPLRPQAVAPTPRYTRSPRPQVHDSIRRLTTTGSRVGSVGPWSSPSFRTPTRAVPQLAGSAGGGMLPDTRGIRWTWPNGQEAASHTRASVNAPSLDWTEWQPASVRAHLGRDRHQAASRPGSRLSTTKQQESSQNQAFASAMRMHRQEPLPLGNASAKGHKGSHPKTTELDRVLSGCTSDCEQVASVVLVR